MSGSRSVSMGQSIPPPSDDGYLSRNLLDDDDGGTFTYSPPPSSPPPPVPVSPIEDPRVSRSLPIIPARPIKRERGKGRHVLALDFGTTFTGIAFTTTSASRGDLAAIEVLQDWTTSMSNKEKVPSVYSYTKPQRGEAQWGSDIGEDAVTMVNQKLELEVQENRIDELNLTLYVLRGTKFLSFDNIREVGSEPAFSPKTPYEIITDYLTKVFECVKASINAQELTRTNTPIDLVVTTPVCWSYEAHNSMFKAVNDAGFNTTALPTLQDIISVSEPEAAAYFAALDLKNQGHDFLEEDQTFVLCDAGGGTVDTVAYQVKKVTPFLELERATEPTGEKCGSALIDLAFKSWFRDVVGAERYAELDSANAYQRRINPHTAETGPMRELIKRFIARKVVFSNANQEAIKIDLPTPLNTLSIDGRIDQGELTIKWDEMKDLMDTCVSPVITLVMDQIDKVDRQKGRRSKDVILVGGFGASPYLQEELHEGFGIFKRRLRRPDVAKSLTAVVQGGVVYGIEKSRHKTVTYVTEIMDSFGVDHRKGRLDWVIKRGDTVLLGQTRVVESTPFWCASGASSRGKQEFKVYRYLDRKRELDDLPDELQTAHREVVPVGTIKTGPGNDINRFDRGPRQEGGAPSPGDKFATGHEARVGPMKWRFSLTDTSLKVELFVKENAVGSCNITVELLPSRSKPETASEDAEK